MALTVGAVTVNADGTHTGTGITLTLFESYFMPPVTPNLPKMSKALRVEVKTIVAGRAQALATAILNHLTANGEVTVTVAAADAGLQQTPTPNNAGTATVGPAAPVVLATKGTIG